VSYHLSRRAVVSRRVTAAGVITRFAPAPTGYLHLGHVVNAIHVWGIARASGDGGGVLLRIEDHDATRCRPEYEAALLEDLAWLGFDADGPLVRQSERGALYEQALSTVRLRGQVYACACSRADVGSSRYPGTCATKQLPETSGMGIRVRIDPAIEQFNDRLLGPQAQQPSEQCGDLLVRDRHGSWTYQFAAVVDDWDQGVTLVVRGVDLLDSTGRQIQLARLLGRPEPPAFLHHVLLMKSPTQKISKSDGDTGVRDLRAKGWSPQQVIGHAAMRAGLSSRDEPIRADEVFSLFPRR